MTSPEYVAYYANIIQIIQGLFAIIGVLIAAILFLRRVRIVIKSDDEIQPN